MGRIEVRTINCVVQCRVSTLSQAQEGESLEVQEATLRRFVAQREWTIVPNSKVWKTAISGRKVGRVDFEEILAFIKKNPGLVQYYVFRSIDRATRAGSVEYGRMKEELAKQGVQMVDTYGVIQPSVNTLEDLGFSYTWSTFSPSEITEGVLSTTAKQEVTTILTRLMGQEIRLTQQGYRTRRATDGYINQKVYIDGKRKPIQAPDPQRAKFFVAMFELRAQGLSDPEIVGRVNAMGYRTPVHQRWNKEHTRAIGRRGGKPLTIKKLQRDIQNPIYAGVLCEKWTHYKPVKAQYSGLVSIDLWNRANRGRFILREHQGGSVELANNYESQTGTVRNRFNPLFPFKFILCPLCRKPLRGSEPRSKSGRRVPYYHCSRPGHRYFGVPKSDLEGSVMRYILSLKFDTSILPGLEATLLNKYREREEEIVRASGLIHQNIADLEMEQAAKLEAYTSSKSSVVRDMLEREIEALEARIKDGGRQRFSIQISRDDIKAYVQGAKKIMEHPGKLLLNQADPRVQKDLFFLVFEEMPTYDEIVNGTPKLTFVFKVSSEFRPGEKQLVPLLSLSWNTLEETVLRWKSIRNNWSTAAGSEEG